MNYLMLILPAILWGSLGVFVNNINMPSTQIAFVRTILASVTLIIIYAFGKSKINKAAFKKNIPKLILAGAFIGFNWVFLFQAYKEISVSVATVVYYLAPAIVIGASPFVFKEKLSFNKIIGLISALIGMAFVSLSAGVGEVSIAGILLAFAGAVSYAMVTLINKSIKGFTGFEVAMIELIIAGIILTPYVFLITKDPWIIPDTQGLINLLIIGVVHTGLAYGMYFTAVQRVPVQTTAICSFADPFSAIIISAIFLNEKMSIVQICGAVMIIGGAMVAELYKGKKAIASNVKK